VTIFDVSHSALDAEISPADHAHQDRSRLRRASRSSSPMRDVLGHYRAYRAAFPTAAISCAGQALWQPEVAAGVKKRGYSVDVHSCDELDVAVSAGIPVSRIVVHDDGITAAPIRRAVGAGVGGLVLRCCQQVGVVSACGGRPPLILVDISADCADATIAAVLGRPQLNLIGLQARLSSGAHRWACAETVTEVIALMAHVRREHGVILARVSLVGGEVMADCAATTSVLRELANELDDAFDDACARYRFPRPALMLAPRYWP